MAWLYLIVAGLLEIVWAVSLKRTEGFTKLGPSLFTLVTMAASFYLLRERSSRRAASASSLGYR